VLESVFEAWKVIPKAAVADFDTSKIKKILKPLKSAYSFLLEMPGQMLFFWAKPYWQHCVLAIWRLYWALVLDKEPLPRDLATAGALYFREKDFVKAAKGMAKELKKSWKVDREKIKKEKFPFKPDQVVEPETLRFLREAVMDLVDLHNREALPSICLAHHKVYWADCPVCREKAENDV